MAWVVRIYLTDVGVYHGLADTFDTAGSEAIRALEHREGLPCDVGNAIEARGMLADVKRSIHGKRNVARFCTSNRGRSLHVEAWRTHGPLAINDGAIPLPMAARR